MKNAPYIVIMVAFVLIFFHSNSIICSNLQQFTVDLSADHGVYEMNAARLQGKQLRPFNFSQVFNNTSRQGESTDHPPPMGVIQMSEKERNSENFSRVAGNHIAGMFEWRGKDIVRHKCEGCDGGQDWSETGNSYTLLYKHRRFYCEDAASIYATTSP